jgi:hypothetical protein
MRKAALRNETGAQTAKHGVTPLKQRTGSISAVDSGPPLPQSPPGAKAPTPGLEPRFEAGTSDQPTSQPRASLQPARGARFATAHTGRESVADSCKLLQTLSVKSLKLRMSGSLER